MVRITKVEIYDGISEDRPRKTVASFIEAAEFCTHQSIHKLVFHLTDGKQLVFDSIGFSNDKNTVEIIG